MRLLFHAGIGPAVARRDWSLIVEVWAILRASARLEIFLEQVADGKTRFVRIGIRSSSSVFRHSDNLPIFGNRGGRAVPGPNEIHETFLRWRLKNDAAGNGLKAPCGRGTQSLRSSPPYSI